MIFFSRLGIELSIIDIKEVRGGEIICDLNHPVSEDLKCKYDIVYDGGTLEHCFNVAQAVTNILSMAKVKGFIIHNNPLVLINHGFYNFSPTFYYDFYVQNGHKLASEIVGTKNDGLDVEKWSLHPTKRLQDAPTETGISVVVRKLNASAPIFPVQTKYLEKLRYAAGASEP